MSKDNYEYYNNDPQKQLKAVVSDWLKNKADIILDDNYSFDAEVYRRYLTHDLSELIKKNTYVDGTWKNHNYFYEIICNSKSLNIQLTFYYLKIENNPNRDAKLICDEILNSKFSKKPKPEEKYWKWAHRLTTTKCDPYSKEDVFRVMDQLYAEMCKYESDVLDDLRSKGII